MTPTSLIQAGLAVAGPSAGNLYLFILSVALIQFILAHTIPIIVKISIHFCLRGLKPPPLYSWALRSSGIGFSVVGSQQLVADQPHIPVGRRPVQCTACDIATVCGRFIFGVTTQNIAC